MSGLVQRPSAPQLFQQSLRAIRRDRRYTAEARDTFVVSKAHGATSSYENHRLVSRLIQDRHSKEALRERARWEKQVMKWLLNLIDYPT